MGRNKNVLIAVAGLAFVIPGSEKEAASDMNTQVVALPSSEATLATIVPEEEAMAITRAEIIARLPEVEVMLTPEINTGLVGSDDIVISPDDNPGCAIQLSYYYHEAASLPNVNIAFAAPTDIFRSDDESYGRALFSNQYSHIEIDGSGQSGVLIEGVDVNMSLPESLEQALGYIANLAERYC